MFSQSRYFGFVPMLSSFRLLNREAIEKKEGSRSPAQSDIDPDHWAVNVDSVVPNAPVRLSVALG